MLVQVLHLLLETYNEVLHTKCKKTYSEEFSLFPCLISVYVMSLL